MEGSWSPGMRKETKTIARSLSLSLSLSLTLILPIHLHLSLLFLQEEWDTVLFATGI